MAGLTMVSIAVGNYLHSAPIAFMILGGGIVLVSMVMGLLIYLKPTEYKELED